LQPKVEELKHASKTYSTSLAKISDGEKFSTNRIIMTCLCFSNKNNTLKIICCNLIYPIVLCNFGEKTMAVVLLPFELLKQGGNENRDIAPGYHK